MSSASFSSLSLNPALLENLKSLNYHQMTPIQQQSLPLIFDGKDVIAQARTGSGKTAAFALGLLNRLDVKRFRVQSLVLCPTRELADQVAKEIRKLARLIHNIKVLTLCGGAPFGPQIGSLEHGAHIIVGTPGRIEEHLRKGTLVLDKLEMLVLDEADRMLDMGFQASLDTIIDQLPRSRQTLLFSATYPDQIEAVAQRVMRQPQRVEALSTHDDTSIEQQFYCVDSQRNRLTALKLLLMAYQPQSCLVFCNTKRETQEVADALGEFGFNAAALHGDLEQRERDQTLVQFANKSVTVLVATDVAARGLDIDAMDAVINYQIARETEVHVHRIGRTGRAGSKGIAFTLFDVKENYKVERLEDYLKCSIDVLPLPEVRLLNEPAYRSQMVTLQIDGGKRQKLRAGDILGALTAGNGITGTQVGKIHLFDNCAYVAVNIDIAKSALAKISKGKLKGRSFRARKVGRG